MDAFGRALLFSLTLSVSVASYAGALALKFGDLVLVVSLNEAGAGIEINESFRQIEVHIG